MLALPTTPSPKRFGNTYPFDQKSEKNNETTKALLPSVVVTTTADLCTSYARAAKKRAEKRSIFIIS